MLKEKKPVWCYHSQKYTSVSGSDEYLRGKRGGLTSCGSNFSFSRTLDSQFHAEGSLGGVRAPHLSVIVVQVLPSNPQVQKSSALSRGSSVGSFSPADLNPSCPGASPGSCKECRCLGLTPPRFAYRSPGTRPGQGALKDPVSSWAEDHCILACNLGCSHRLSHLTSTNMCQTFVVAESRCGSWRRPGSG